MSKIRIVNGPYRGREKTLGDKALTIGRDAEAGIQILDRSASRFHVEIFPVGGMYFIRDLDSKNGTYVNDEKIPDEELLRERDVIKIGSTELIFESGSALTDDDSSNRISYRDDPDILSNTLEFRLDELSDISEPKEEQAYRDSARSLRILYQISRMLSEEGATADKELRVLDYLVQSMPAESALIFRRDSVSGKLVPTAVRTSAPGIQPVISRSIIKKTFSENKALHTANAQDDDRFERSPSIVQKGIRSVVCVPLVVSGHSRGVLYLGRGENGTPFDQIDLELVSASAIQLGMSQAAAEQQRRHQATLWKTIGALVLSLEGRLGISGSGGRCARSCSALAHAMELDEAARERLGHAGLIHHLDRLCDAAGGKALEPLATIPEFDDVLHLIRGMISAGLRDADDGDDIEGHILAAAAAFERRTCEDPGADVAAVIEAMSADPGFDRGVLTALQACHFDGTLYRVAGGAPSGAEPAS